MAKKQPKQKNNKSSKWLTPAIIAGVLVMIAICIWLFRPGPLDKVRSAAKKTFFTQNFTAQYELTVNGQSMDGVIKAAIDRNKNQIDMAMQLTTVVSDYACGIYDNTFVVFNTTNGKSTAVDITDRVTNFFTLLENEGQPDWSVLLNLEDTDLHQTISEDFDFDAFLSCLGQWLDNMNDPAWAEKNAGYSKEKVDGITTYCYNPDPYTLANQTAPIFKKAFLKSDRYEALENYIDDAKYLFKDGTADISFGVKNGRLVATELSLEYLNTKINCNIRFSDIGSTEVDTSTIAYYIEEAKK